jgi:hypothetical protein
MCKKHSAKKKYSLAGFFNSHWDAYVKDPKERILPEQYRAVNAMLACRTPKLGTDIYKCPDCEKEHYVYHSCRNRFCPTCGYLDTLNWCDSIITKMVNRPHHHVVVMLPSGFRDLARKNRKLVYSMLMYSAAEAFKEFFRCKWKVEPGIMSVLQTFGDDKKYHVHVHMILTAGGINKKTGQYKEIDTKKWFVNYSWFCNKKFRPIFLKYLRRDFKNGKLKHDFSSKEEFEQLLSGESDKKWRMHIEEPLNDVEHIVKYTGRYTKRACLSEYKISNIEGEYLSFECKDYKNSKDKKDPKIIEKTYHYRDFFPRLLQHVPEKHFRTVRYYGIYHQIDRNVPKKLRKSKEEVQAIKEKELTELENYESPLMCPICKKRMQYVMTLFDTRKRNRREWGQYKIPDDPMVLTSFKRKIKKTRLCT